MAAVFSTAQCLAPEWRDRFTRAVLSCGASSDAEIAETVATVMAQIGSAAALATLQQQRREQRRDEVKTRRHLRVVPGGQIGPRRRRSRRTIEPEPAA